MKKLQKENRDKVPAGGFIDLGKYLSILSTLLSESVAKIAPKVTVIAHALINFLPVSLTTFLARMTTTAYILYVLER